MEEERRSTSARQNWRKVFAVRKFLSLAKFQSQQPPADLLVGQGLQPTTIKTHFCIDCQCDQMASQLAKVKDQLLAKILPTKYTLSFSPNLGPVS